MARVVVFDEWRFEKGERAVVRWFRSPLRGPDKQWLFTVVLRGQTSALIEHTVPWGVLALLRLGQIYVDGMPVAVQGQEETFTITSTPKLAEAASALSAQFYPLRHQENLAEQCFVFSTAEDVQLVLPVLEGVRALLAFNKSLLLGTMQTNYLRKIVHSDRVEGSTLYLDFAAKMEDTGLLNDKGFVRHVARLLYDPSFESAWGTVWHRHQLEMKNRSRQSIPLSFDFPRLGQAWQVRGFRGEGVFLILELIRVTPEVLLPFSRIIYNHPNLQQPKVIMTDHQTETKRPRPTTIIIDGTSRSASRHERIYIPMASSALEEPEELDVSQEKTTDESVERNPIIVTGVPKDDPEVVTVTDTGTQPKGKTGEFTQKQKQVPDRKKEDGEDEKELESPQKLSDDELLDSFSKFIKVVEELKKTLGKEKVEQELYKVPQDIPFGRIYGQPRRFLLVTMKLEDGAAYLIEIEAPDERKVSNLMFCFEPYEALETVDKVLGKLFSEVLAPKGWWQLTALEKFKKEMKLPVTLIRHSQANVEQRAKTLINVARSLLQGVNTE